MLAATNAARNYFMETDRSMGVDLRVLKNRPSFIQQAFIE